MSQGTAHTAISKMVASERYRIHPAAFYCAIDDAVFVCQTEQRKVLEFNGAANDILGCFEASMDIEGALAHLRKVYDVDDEGEFRQSVTSFVSELVGKRILLADGPQASQRECPVTLERKMQHRFIEAGRLQSVTMELTYHCNERCRHCYIVDEGRPEMSTEKAKAVIDELADMGVADITLTGGEVFARKDAFEILEHAYKRHLVMDVFTNGVLLDSDACIRLKALWPRCVHFSVYSPEPGKHDAITRVPGSFEKTVAAIRKCSLIGIPVNIKTPIFEETRGDIQGMVELAASLGASLELGNNITPRKDGDLAPLAMAVQGESENRGVAEAIREVMGVDRLPDSALVRSDKICTAGESSISINPYGEVFPCALLPLPVGDVYRQSVREIWEGSDALLWWREHNQRGCKVGCEGCSLADACVFCPGEALLRTGDPLSKYKKACLATQQARCEGR